MDYSKIDNVNASVVLDNPELAFGGGYTQVCRYQANTRKVQYLFRQALDSEYGVGVVTAGDGCDPATFEEVGRLLDHGSVGDLGSTNFLRVG